MTEKGRFQTCSRCGEDTGPFPAWINDEDGVQAFCHKDEQRRSCYELATWDRSWARGAFAGLALPDENLPASAEGKTT